MKLRCRSCREDYDHLRLSPIEGGGLALVCERCIGLHRWARFHQFLDRIALAVARRRMRATR